MKRGKYGISKLLFVLLLVFFLVSVILPTLCLFKKAGETSWTKIFGSEHFRKALFNSIRVSMTATMISIVLGYLFAWCLERCKVTCSGIIKSIFTFPMLIPSISLGTGTIILLGRNGILTRILNIKGSIYGFWGIVIGSVLYSFPVAFLMISDMLRMEDGTPYEAARVLGIDKLHRFTSITFPYIRKPMISVVFAVFTMIVTDYGVPLMVGGQYITLPVIMYQDVIGMLDFAKGSVIGIILLIPAVLAFILDMLNKDVEKSSFVTKKYRIRTDRHSVVFATILSVIGVILILLPICSFLLLAFATDYPNNLTFTFKNIITTFDMKAGNFLVNSLVIGFFVSILGAIVAFMSAYITVRMNIKGKRLLHFFSILTLAIPGIALGLSYTLFFNKTAIYGTLLILILVNTLHFISSPYLMMYNSLGKINPNLEAVGDTMGIPRLSMVFRIIIPMIKSSFFEMLSYFFINSMMTISAVAFLSTRKTQPISLMIPTFEAQMMLENIGVVSLIILIINLCVKHIFSLARKKI